MPVILAFDPSATAVGWALMAPKAGLYSILDCGMYSPSSIVKKRGGPDLDRAEIALLEAGRLMDRFQLAKFNSLVLVEHAAIGGGFSAQYNNRSMEVVLSMAVATKSAAWDRYLKVISVYPISWQSKIRSKLIDGKEAARILSQNTYGLHGLSQDTCDAIGIAHFGAIMHDKVWLDDDTRKLEEQIESAVLKEKGRDAVVEAYNLAFVKEPNKDYSERYVLNRSAFKTYTAKLEEYKNALRKARKETELPPMSSVKIAGDIVPKAEKPEDEFLKLMEGIGTIKI